MNGIYAVIQDLKGNPKIVEVDKADKYELYAIPNWEFGYDDCVLVTLQGDEQVRVLTDYEIEELKNSEDSNNNSHGHRHKDGVIP